MVNLRISDFYNRSKKVNINVNNKDIEAYEGECLAVVLFINNIKKLRLSPKKKTKQGNVLSNGVLSRMRSTY